MALLPPSPQASALYTQHGKAHEGTLSEEELFKVSWRPPVGPHRPSVAPIIPTLLYGVLGGPTAVFDSRQTVGKQIRELAPKRGDVC